MKEQLAYNVSTLGQGDSTLVDRRLSLDEAIYEVAAPGRQDSIGTRLEFNGYHLSRMAAELAPAVALSTAMAPSITGMILPGAAGLLGMRAYERKLRNDSWAQTAEALEVQNRIQYHFDHPTDVVKDSQGHMVMRWYGFDAEYHVEAYDPLFALSELEKVTAFAQAEGINKITVASAPIEKIIGDVGVYGIVTNGERYIGNLKKKPLQDKLSDDRVLEMTPETAKEVTFKIIDQINTDPMDLVMEVLGKRNPAHTLVDLYSQYKVYKIPLHKLRSAARRLIEETYGGDVVRERQESTHGAVRVVKAHTSALVGPTNVMTWSVYHNGQGTEAKVREGVSLMGAYGARSLQELVLAIRNDPSNIKAQEAAIYLLSGYEETARRRLLRDCPRGIKTDKTVVARSLQCRMVDEPSSLRYAYKLGETDKKAGRTTTPTVTYTAKKNYEMRAFFKDLTAAYIVTWAALSGGILAENSVERHEEKRREQFSAALAGKTEGISFDEKFNKFLEQSSSPADLLVRGRIEAEKWTKRVDDVIDTYVSDVFHDLDSSFIPKVQRAPAGPGSRFGESGTQKNQDKSVWNVEGLNGASTRGYWTMEVHNLISTDPAYMGSPLPPYTDVALISGNVYEDVKKGEVELLDTKDDIPQDIPAIRVDGTFRKDDYSRFVAYDEDHMALEVPILNGTKIYSAYKYHDEWHKRNYFKAVRYPDGTQKILLPRTELEGRGLKGEIRYFLVPDKNSTVRADQDMVIYRKGQVTGTFEDSILEEQASEVWQALPGKQGALPSDPEQVSNMIQTTHTYSLTPYKDAGVKGTVSLYDGGYASDGTMIANIAKTAAELPSTLCNLASLQEMVMTRGVDAEGKPLNFVVGFAQNTNDYSLSVGERHMWVVDNDGEIIDATPSRSNGTEQNLTESNDPFHAIVGAVAVGGVIGGTGWAVFPRIRRRYKKFRTNVSRSALLNNANFDTVIQSGELAKWLAYSSIDGAVTGEKIAERARMRTADTDTEKRAYVRTLPNINRKDVRALLKERGMSAYDARARKLVRLMRNLNHAKSAL